MTRFSKEVRNMWKEAALESMRRQDGYIGSEHLLLGLMANPVGLAATVTGVQLEDARAALRRLDDQALASIGIDVAAPDAMPKRRRTRMSMTDSAKRVLMRATRWASRRGEKNIDERHVLLAICDDERPSLALRLLEELGCDPVQLRATLNERAAS